MTDAELYFQLLRGLAIVFWIAGIPVAVAAITILRRWSLGKAGGKPGLTAICLAIILVASGRLSWAFAYSLDRSWPALVLAVAGMVFLLLLRPKSLRLDIASQALEQAPLEQWTDLGGYAELGGQQETTRFVNGFISIFYIRSLYPGKKIETIDFTVNGFSGGYKITFVDDSVVQWIHNAVETPLNMTHPARHDQVHKILETVRQAYAAKKQ